MLPWQFFATALNDCSVSLVNNSNLISKVYFPRFIVPSGAVITNNVTLNGNSTLNLFGNNTLAGLIFNNLGGGATNPTVNTFTSGSPANGAGTLTIGASVTRREIFAR